jgi:pimeloyl-ACP methyl ester carboxylesterase
VTAAVTLAGIAPFPVDDPDDADAWFAGMADDAGPRAALRGRDDRARCEETAEFEPGSFIDRDYAALDGPWAGLGEDVAAAAAFGMGGLIDDDCAFVRAWGVDPGSISQPVLVIQGGRDRVVPQSHAKRLVRAIPNAELWLRPHDGHVSVLDACGVAMDWTLQSQRTP